MQLINPTKPNQFLERNILLQNALRPQSTRFPIQDEYPIVLSPFNSSLSYCFQDATVLCAHANLWPRRVRDRSLLESYQVGLVGNVATAETHRGKGLMRDLISNLVHIANEQNLSALILWSDLSEFYHKLGFESLGKEYHFHFDAMELERLTKVNIFELSPERIDATVLNNIMELRYKVPLTLERSLTDYQVLSRIPNMKLYTAWEDTNLVGFSWIGKGEDMVGVIHEWGAYEPEYMLDIVQFVTRAQDLDRIMVLSPFELNETWYQAFIEESILCETIPMAFTKILDESKRDSLASLFIWGIDSI